VYARYDHARDDLGRVTLEQQDGLLFQGYGTNNVLTLNYAYDARGQLQAASAMVNSNTVPLTDRYFSTTYDNAANRTMVRRLGTTSAYDRSYTPNALNQYSSRDNLPYDDARGMAPSGVTVSVVAQSTTDAPRRRSSGTRRRT
jgi:hypothetical protein